MSALDAAYEALKADGRVSVSRTFIGGGEYTPIVVNTYESRRTVRVHGLAWVDGRIDATLYDGDAVIATCERIAPEAIADIAAAWVLEGRLP